MGAVALYSAVATALVLFIVRAVMGLRVGEEAELVGLDLAEHREKLGA